MGFEVACRGQETKQGSLRSELSHPSTFVIGALCMNLARTQRHFVILNGISSFTKFTKRVRK